MPNSSSMVSVYACVFGWPVTFAAIGPPMAATRISRPMTTPPASATLSSRKRAQKSCQALLLVTCDEPVEPISSVAEVTSVVVVIPHSLATCGWGRTSGRKYKTHVPPRSWRQTQRSTFGVVLPGRLLRERVRARDDLEDLLRDLRLAGAVHRQRQRVDQLSRGLRRIAHRGHPGPLLGRGRLEQRAVDLRLDVDRKQPPEDVARLRLEEEVDGCDDAGPSSAA